MRDEGAEGHPEEPENGRDDGKGSVHGHITLADAWPSSDKRRRAQGARMYLGRLPVARWNGSSSGPRRMLGVTYIVECSICSQPWEVSFPLVFGAACSPDRRARPWDAERTDEQGDADHPMPRRQAGWHRFRHQRRLGEGLVATQARTTAPRSPGPRPRRVHRHLATI